MLRYSICIVRTIGVGVGHGGYYVPAYSKEITEYVSIAEVLRLIQSITSHPSIGAELTRQQISQLLVNAVTYAKATKQQTNSSESNK
jgi:hypothetical protein